MRTADTGTNGSMEVWVHETRETTTSKEFEATETNVLPCARSGLSVAKFLLHSVFTPFRVQHECDGGGDLASICTRSLLAQSASRIRSGLSINFALFTI